MWAIVEQDEVKRVVSNPENLQGSNYTHSDIRLVDRQTRLEDGVYDFVEGTFDSALNNQTGEHFVIDYAAGTVTRVYEYVAKPSTQLASEASAKALADARQGLSNSDTQMGRVVEDLIATLITKGIITATDLPQPSADKISARKTWRAEVNGTKK
ncbi:MAG: hypothetical protein ACYCZQ_03290 [Burkholderiales bacterium]